MKNYPACKELTTISNYSQHPASHMQNMTENMIEMNNIILQDMSFFSWHSSSFSRNSSFSFQTHTGLENSTGPDLRVPQAAGQVKILIFLVKIIFSHIYQ